MATLKEIVTAMDGWLRTPAIPDYPAACNGLQIENSGPITRVACAVDACEPVIRHAITTGADLLLVHHGLFWSPTRPLVGPAYRKIKLTMDGNLAIYASHIPLDIHAELGNNIGLARSIGMLDAEPFFPWKGIPIGLRGTLGTTRDDLVANLSSALGAPVHLCPGGSAQVTRVGIITGGAGSEIHELAKHDIDTFITGEGPHWSYTAAEELGINLIYAGHYATETFGVKALAGQVASTFDLPWEFIDHPTGL